MWHSSLTKENRQDLERVQKAALRVIMKEDYDGYKNALKMARIESLEDSREMLSLKFAKKCLNNANYSKVFPLNKLNHGMSLRNPMKYAVKKANTERLKRSSIPYKQNLLNLDNRKRKMRLDDLDNQLNQTKKENSLK